MPVGPFKHKTQVWKRRQTVDVPPCIGAYRTKRGWCIKQLDGTEEVVWRTKDNATANAATIQRVRIPDSGTYTTGQFIQFTIAYNEPVTVTGTPTIPLTVGANTRNLSYLSGSGTNILVFSYTVQAGDAAPAGVQIGNNITLAGGTIQDVLSSATASSLLFTGASWPSPLVIV